MSTAPRRKAPALFHRVFLSHLLVLLLCFIAGLVLLDYLFADGLRLYRVRSPLILLPAVLGLIGLAGLLALWSSGVVALALQRLSRALDRDSNEAELQTLAQEMHCEEAAEVADAAAEQLLRAARRLDARPLILVIDAHLNILSADIDTAALLAALPSELKRRNLRGYLIEAADREFLLETLQRSGNAISMQPRRMPVIAAGGGTLNPLWHLHPLGEGRYVFIGTDIRRG
ncbi:MAG: PAS domain-containing protein [Bacteroidia bacterium]|nr:PAS domain-containing protein [Bacteroidia bacterium]